MITVACVLSEGPTYDASHVERLARQIDGRLSDPYRFVCLTAKDVSCETIRPAHDWPGWWAKIELFRPGLFEGRVLYLDLDVTVVGSLDEIIGYPASFAAIRDYIDSYLCGLAMQAKAARLHFIPGLNSSVMSWDAGAADHIYSDFTPSVMGRLRGDQDWITEQMPHAEVFPEAWCVSYRKHVRMFKAVPPDARVVVYHGLPKPWDVE